MPRTKKLLAIRSITYGRTFNNGNYESSRIDVTVDVFEDEDPEDVFIALIGEVENFRRIEKE